MLFVLATATLEQADRVAGGLEARPFPYFLALTLSVVGVLWGSLVTVALWGANGRLAQAEKRADELKSERDIERKEADRITAEHIRDLVKLTNAADELRTIRLELKKEVEDSRAKRGRSA